MTGEELYEHVRRHANDLDATLWFCATCDEEEGEAHWPERTVYVRGVPDTPMSYLVAMHELGHIDQWATEGVPHYRLDAEAYAWRWALHHSLIVPTAQEWSGIKDRLQSYLNDRRFTATTSFMDMYSRALSNDGLIGLA